MNKYYKVKLPNTDIYWYVDEAEYNAKYTNPMFGGVVVSKEEHDLHELYNVKIPDNDPSTGQPWASDTVKQDWIKLQLQIKGIQKKADNGQLMDDIAVWHNVFSETLIKIIIFKYSTEVAMRVRLKVISDIIAKYNLDLVIKDFKPDYVIPQDDKSKLIDGLKEIEAYDDGIYNRLAQAVGLEYGAIHNEVIDAYERIINSIHPTQTPQIDPNIVNGKETLTHELGGTTK